ncbi:MAG TPA: glycoside hydrolase family 3 C-terminal domain-containing protein, partial [Spirochaetia bacterium]|nr:glycoside hydrolase family 3 C-terminal domain-containing protein [Spirochaetia bacterium]
MDEKVRELVRKMSLEEKASLCSGMDFWTTKPIERLEIPSIMMTDGPHGLRKASGGSDEVGLSDSVPATCFPTGSGLAASWNRELAEKVGLMLGIEAQAENVAVLLGPAVNIKRSPLCGRNFEYLSEDSYLAGQIAKHHILGVQSQGVGTSIKHFAANNQERLRMVIDVVVDRRTLREIYLSGFETAIKEGRPWTVMCAYNRLNGSYCAENEWLLTTLLRAEWGYAGIVVTDWGACNDRVAGLAAGQDLEMPGNGGINDGEIVRAVKAGELDEALLDRAVERLLGLVKRGVAGRRAGVTFDPAAHHRIAREAAGECMVLLKNDDGTLPLEAKGRIAFIGEFARTPRYQGGGSSHINPTRIDSALEAARAAVGSGGEILFAPGYTLKAVGPEPTLTDEAADLAAGADCAVVFIGLTDSFESEGFDRAHLGIPEGHTKLLDAVLAVQEKVVVVLSNGSPIEMPWVSAPKAILESYLGGQASGGAVADILFGSVNPSGKLAESFPARLEDNPSFLSFPGDGKRVEYREGIFVGYRYYDKKAIEPLFPFGHGLSYTTFDYADLRLSAPRIDDSRTLQATVLLRNSGRCAGKEVVQLYVEDIESSVPRPVRELKGFQKISLDPGESAEVVFSLDKRSFAFWDEDLGDWRVESGEFRIWVGASSRDLRSSATVFVESTTPGARRLDLNSTVLDLSRNTRGAEIAEQIRARFLDGFGAVDPDSVEAL